MAYKPPYTLSTNMVQSIGRIRQLIGQIEGFQLLTSDVKLRKVNRIKSLQSSLAIEGNTLTIEQITTILAGKPVIGPPQDLLEAKNALALYDRLDELDPLREDDLLDAHRQLMNGLIQDAGNYRQGGVGVVGDGKVIHIAPPHRMVPELMGKLFDYLCNYDEEIVIKSCVFHYEFEFIHPFSDGNGRMGRLWQTAILKSHFPVLSYVPFETIIHARQQAYYDALTMSQSVGNSDPFILFMLDALEEALKKVISTEKVSEDPSQRIIGFKDFSGLSTFSRKNYLDFYKKISPATASRDLTAAVKSKVLKKTGDKNSTRYHFT